MQFSGQTALEHHFQLLCWTSPLQGPPTDCRWHHEQNVLRAIETSLAGTLTRLRSRLLVLVGWVILQKEIKTSHWPGCETPAQNQAVRTACEQWLPGCWCPRNNNFISITARSFGFSVLSEVRRKAYTSSATKHKVESKLCLLLFNNSSRRLSGQLSTQESQKSQWQLLLPPVPLALTLIQSNWSQTQEGKPHRSPHYFNNNYHLLFSSVYEKLLNSLL